MKIFAPPFNRKEISKYYYYPVDIIRFTFHCRTAFLLMTLSLHKDELEKRNCNSVTWIHITPTLA